MEQGEVTWESTLLGRTVNRLVEQGEVTWEGTLLGRAVYRLIEQRDVYVLGKVKFLYGQSID